MTHNVCCRSREKTCEIFSTGLQSNFGISSEIYEETTFDRYLLTSTVEFCLEKFRDSVLPTLHFLPALLPSLKRVFSLILAAPCICGGDGLKNPPLSTPSEGESFKIW